jgi:hypothetical protein
MKSDLVYLLMFRGVPVRAHTRFEGASEEMASYPPGRQKDMQILSMRLVNDD